MMICIRAGRSSKFGQIRPWTADLAALEHLKKFPFTYNRTKWCFHFFSAVLDQILFIHVGNDEILKGGFEIWSDPTTDHRVNCP